MHTARILFKACDQKSQVIGSDGKRQDHLQAELVFDLEVDGRLVAQDLRVGIGQPYGTDYSVEPLEAASIRAQYDGLWNQTAFSDACETYFRRLVGPGGMISVGNSRNVQMSDNYLGVPMAFEIKLPKSSGGAW